MKNTYIEPFLEERIFFGLLNRDPEELDKLSEKDNKFKLKMKTGKYNLFEYPEYLGLLTKHILAINKLDDELYVYIKSLVVEFVEKHKEKGYYINDTFVYKGTKYNFYRILKTSLNDDRQ